MNTTNPKREMINLLSWIKTHGLTPRQPGQSDRFLCPFTGRVLFLSQMLPHQRRTALWIPSVSGLRQHGMDVKVGQCGPLKTVEGRYFFGAGAGETEATLSFLNQMKHEAEATVCC